MCDFEFDVMCDCDVCVMWLCCVIMIMTCDCDVWLCCIVIVMFNLWLWIWCNVWLSLWLWIWCVMCVLCDCDMWLWIWCNVWLSLWLWCVIVNLMCDVWLWCVCYVIVMCDCDMWLWIWCNVWLSLWLWCVIVNLMCDVWLWCVIMTCNCDYMWLWIWCVIMTCDSVCFSRLILQLSVTLSRVWSPTPCMSSLLWWLKDASPAHGAWRHMPPLMKQVQTHRRSCPSYVIKHWEYGCLYCVIAETSTSVSDLSPKKEEKILKCNKL